MAAISTASWTNLDSAILCSEQVLPEFIQYDAYFPHHRLYVPSTILKGPSTITMSSRYSFGLTTFRYVWLSFFYATGCVFKARNEISCLTPMAVLLAVIE